MNILQVHGLSHASCTFDLINFYEFNNLNRFETIFTDLHRFALNQLKSHNIYIIGLGEMTDSWLNRLNRMVRFDLKC